MHHVSALQKAGVHLALSCAINSIFYILIIF
jgi:hypothetical protein